MFFGGGKISEMSFSLSASLAIGLACLCMPQFSIQQRHALRRFSSVKKVLRKILWNPRSVVDEVKTDDVHLKFGFVAVLNHGANDSVLNFAVVQVDADFVGDFEFAFVGLL